MLVHPTLGDIECVIWLMQSLTLGAAALGFYNIPHYSMEEYVHRIELISTDVPHALYGLPEPLLCSTLHCCVTPIGRHFIIIIIMLCWPAVFMSLETE